MQAQTQVRELMGMSVTDTNGTKVGTIKQVYLNDDSGSPEWVTVHTGWFGMRESFVPLTGANKSQDALQVPYDKETIKGAPNVDADEHLSHAQIVDLYRHYGVRPPGGRGPGETETSGKADEKQAAGTEGKASTEGKAGTETAGSPGMAGKAGMAGVAGAAGTAGTPGMAVHPDKGKRGERPEKAPQPDSEGEESPLTEITRSEERMRIDTERHESSRVHVHKWIETEMVERTIPVSHEELRVDREPIKDGRPSAEVSLAEDDLEIILYEERPIIAKETIPVERVRVRTEQVEDEQTVRGELRKERIEVRRDEEPPTGREEQTTTGGERGGRPG